MKPTIVKEFLQYNGTCYRIVETPNDMLTVPPTFGKYYLEYQAQDLMGDPQWRPMMSTAATLKDPDPLAVMLRELRAMGWF